MPASPKTVRARRERVAAIVPLLRERYPDVKCSLDFTSPLELLVATILSAQCTDARVNLVTKNLFAKYKTPADYADAPPGELEADIRQTGFFNAKAKSLRAMASTLRERFGNVVPQTLDELTSLAGVGRKTANVLLGNAFGLNEGVVVDTHVTRLSNRLGLTKHPADAVKIEQDLIPIVPREAWCDFSHLLIHHGRDLCTARKPDCEGCPLLPHCPAGPKLIGAGQTRTSPRA
jgi:endonuclease III